MKRKLSLAATTAATFACLLAAGIVIGLTAAGIAANTYCPNPAQYEQIASLKYDAYRAELRMTKITAGGNFDSMAGMVSR